MSLPLTFTGAPWRVGLPPGVYEEKPRVAARRAVQMDVAAFVGLTERGPVAVPVVVESWGAYQEVFGAAGCGRLLPQSVYLFFANGGRRCVVVRALNCDTASTAGWTLGGLRSASGDGSVRPFLFARNPGAWGNRLRTTLRFDLVPASLEMQDGELTASPDGPRPGSLIRYPDTAAAPGSRHKYCFVSDLQPQGTRRTRLSVDAADNALTEMTEPDVLRAVREVRIILDVHLDGALRESWLNAALHPRHPDFLMRRLARPAREEAYRPNDRAILEAAVERDEGHHIEGCLGEEEQGQPGSSFVCPAPETLDTPFIPTLALEDGEIAQASGPDFHGNPHRGDDRAESTERRHFFCGPQSLNGAGVSGVSELSPLDALDTYDRCNETEPVSLVHLPDLVHPDPDPLRDWQEPEAPTPLEETKFGACVATEKTALARLSVYPRLALSHALPEIREWQGRLVEWCEQRADRIAVLDLPPDLGKSEIVAWRQSLDSMRAALYGPYFRCAPAEDPLAPLIVVPPGGAVCGVIARRTRQIGVHAAPANETLNGLVGLYSNPRLPDAAFLHEERVNVIRITERGYDVLGSRTTSSRPKWTHISVRRLVDYLERQLVVDTRWAVFEPNDTTLWTTLRGTVDNRLRGLLDDGAFSGRAAEDSYFIRCDETTNTEVDLDLGRAVVLVGVAPSVPSEFIVFRLTQSADGIEIVEGAGA